MNSIRLVFFDTEFTSWEGSLERQWSESWESREVVQIGAVATVAEREKWREVESFGCLVKPMRNPELSDYFIELTGITQQAVDEEGLDLPDALEGFQNFAKRHGGRCLSWGNDVEILEESCEVRGLDWDRRGLTFENVRPLAERLGISVNGLQSGMLLDHFGLSTEGHHGHDAICDARSIGRSLEHLLDGNLAELELVS
jgi:inhibitor of KinA sporulation pathway (predicted exonuclease)